jgi:hypothetical protein
MFHILLFLKPIYLLNPLWKNKLMINKPEARQILYYSSERKWIRPEIKT